MYFTLREKQILLSFSSQHLLVMRETAARDSRRQLGCSLYVHQHVCVWSLWRDVDEGGGEGRLLVSDFINEGGNVFIPGLDTPTTFLTNPSCCVRVCWRVCVRGFWTRHWLSPIPSSVSLTGPSRRAASLFPPDGTTAQLTPPQPCQHNPRLRPTICSPDPDGRRVGCD